MNKKIIVNDLIKICNAKILSGEKDLEIKNLNKDTRTINKGDIYLGIKGENFDGNKFVKDAFTKGAVACIIDNETYLDFDYTGKTIILVENTVTALQKLASYKRDLYDIPVIGITGSVGKTSTKDIISSVLSKKYKVLKTLGNYNNNIGLPLTIMNLSDHTAMVLEMGMNNLGEISLLSKIAKPTTAVITNIGTAHIEHLGSRENILKAKLEILEGLKENGSLIINNDNDLLNKINYSNKITIGINNKSDYNAINIKEINNETNFDILNENKLFNITSKIGGNAYIYNTLMAYAIGKLYNLTDEEIEYGIKNYKLSKSRLEKHEVNGVTIIDDTYNASLDSMKDSLKYLEKQDGERKIAVLGDIFEIGEFANNIYRELSEYIKTLNIDCVYTVGKDIITVYENLKDSKLNIQHFNTNEEVIPFLKNTLKESDTVLLKASNGMKFYNIVLELINKNS